MGNQNSNKGMHPAEETSTKVNIAFIGAAMVGKTSLIKRFLTGQYSSEDYLKNKHMKRFENYNQVKKFLSV